MVAAISTALELIQIASPCTANWDEMTGDERTRHCSACNRNVYNLSDMTREEATAFLVQREGRTCVRMYKRADGTVITRDCPVGVAALRARLVRTVVATLGLLMALTATALAAFTKSPTIRSYLSQGKLGRIHDQNLKFTVMGGMCPPAIAPAPWNGPAGPALSPDSASTDPGAHTLPE